MIDQRTQGLSYTWAKLFGMPHIGAHYVSYLTGQYTADADSKCVICGRWNSDYNRLNAHHLVPRSVKKILFIGGQEVRSPLWSVCGSGTTGCHNGFHGGARYKASWKWDNPDYKELWWSGEMIERYGPHSEELYRYGQYVLLDKWTETETVLRFA